MSGKRLHMAQEFARTTLRAWRNKERMRCLVVMACGCRALFEVDATPRRYEDLVEGYMALVQGHECPVKNPAQLTAHEEMVEEISNRPPWQDV